MTDPLIDFVPFPPRSPLPADPSREAAIVKRGEAVAHVRALEDLVAFQKTRIDTLEKDLRSTENQRDLLDEDRRKWRADADAYKTVLIELATDMRSVGLLMQRAEETHQRVMNLIARETTEVEAPAITPVETDAIETLNRIASNASLETVQAGARTNP